MARKRRSHVSHPPVYHSMLNDIRNGIKSGKLSVGHWLDSENKMCEVYGISRLSVRKAFGILCQEGSIQSIPGKGYQVIEELGGTGHIRSNPSLSK